MDEKKHLMDALFPLLTDRELRDCAKRFQQDLIAALSNQQSSLPCILNPIARMPVVPGYGVAVSIGGTNGYASAFRISARGVIKFLNRRLFSLPEKTTRDELFERIARNIRIVSRGRKESFPVGIGFAYPLRPLLYHGFIDGELMSMSKERDISELVGRRVGEEFHKYLKTRYSIDTTVAVANDAVCLLLGGNGADLAGVLGTGLNFAYWEKRARVAPLKLNELIGFAQADVAVNIESAQFDKVPATPLRDRVDMVNRQTRGSALSEKEAAGAYLYQLFNAGKDEIVTTSFPALVSTDQINDILTGAFLWPSRITSEQRRTAKLFAKRLFERSAQVLAIQLCGILMKLGKTKGIVPIVMEGGIFWKAKNYHALVNLYVNRILPETIPSFARLFGSSRRGIAMLAMTGADNSAAHASTGK